jgi:hypothetical protein
MNRNFAILSAMAVSVIAVMLLLALAAPASADGSITISGQILYSGADNVLFSPDGANVSARYMGQEYFTRSDSHGDFVVGPIPYGQDQVVEFKINYTDADGNYYVWPANGWQQSLVLSGGNVVQNMILIKSTSPAPTPVPTVTPVPTPSPSPVPEASPSPTPVATTTPTPVPEPSATPMPTKTPSAVLGIVGAVAVLLLTGCLISKKH